MKSKMESMFPRLVVGLVPWSAGVVTTLAQPAAGAVTNAPPTPAATAPSRSGLTFGLDHIEWLQVSWLGNPLWQYLASLSIGGLAVGLAAQDTISNLLGAVARFADQPFRVGDRVQHDAINGTVEVIGRRSTRIRNLDGHLVAVPNRTMANASLTNVSKRPNLKTVMNVGVTCATPADRVERAMAIIEDIFRPHPKLAALIISFNKCNDSSLHIPVVHWWNSTDFKEYLVGFRKLNLELKRRFDAGGIDFAFPSPTVSVKHGRNSEPLPVAHATRAKTVS